MARRSQNGWRVATRDQQDRAPLIRDVIVPNGVLAGDVATVFRWLAHQYDKRVQTLRPGHCWGWFDKPIEGSKTTSNHASGTAVDFNAPSLPMGTPTRQLLSAAQITQCRRIVAESGGVLRWGGDYTERPDAMHWEIVGSVADVAALAERLRRPPVSQPADPSTETWSHDVDPTAAKYSAGGALWTVLGRTSILNQVPGEFAELQQRIAALVADDSVQFDALAGALVLVNAKLDELLRRTEPGSPAPGSPAPASE